jgi:hypothetical protein
MAQGPAPNRHDRLLTPSFVALSVADLAYFTANGSPRRGPVQHRGLSAGLPAWAERTGRTFTYFQERGSSGY